MKVYGAELVVRALEDEGVRWVFGIPGTHNIELYDALERSRVEPVLVTDERSAAFLADGISRTSDQIGVLNVVPGAGVTHAASGVAEAYMDCVPMVILACGIRTDTGHAFQLHDIDQLAVLAPITKGTFQVIEPDHIYPFVRRAFAMARSGCPGPVVVEIPANFYFVRQKIEAIRYVPPRWGAREADEELLDRAAKVLAQAQRPALYAGWGARGAIPELRELAERLSAPVCTTFQGKGVFPENHPLWVWNGFGAMAPRWARQVIDRCDAMLAIGCRFGEVATGSYGLRPPARLVHVDIDPKVPGRNYRAEVAIEGDARQVLSGLLERLERRMADPALEAEIAAGHAKEVRRRRRHRSEDRVSPGELMAALQRHTGDDTVYTTDSGNGTFLAAELLRLDRPSCCIGPVDYSCMGYAVPAAIGAKLANRHRDVVALAGDGALLMTGLELITASNRSTAPLVCVLRDGDLGQIAQFLRTSFNRDTCSVLPPYRLEALAAATGCWFLKVNHENDLDSVVREAVSMTRSGFPVVLEVAIDYSKQTHFTKGVVRTNLARLPLGDRVRKVARALARRLT